MSDEDSKEQLANLADFVKYADSMDIDRRNRWVRASVKLKIFDTWATVTTQCLGNLDSKLVKDDQNFVDTGSVDSPFGDLGDHLTLSYLWVLGAYEIIRALDQRSREDEQFLPELKERLKKLKHEFERIRIPLAKFEAATRHRETDSHIAYPAINTEKGIAWRVSVDVWITRRDLSDSMLELLESINA